MGALTNYFTSPEGMDPPRVPPLGVPNSWETGSQVMEEVSGGDGIISFARFRHLD